MKLFYFLILFCFSTGYIYANSSVFTKEEQNYIDVTNVQVAMVPNIAPFNMYENGKLNGFSYDVLQLITKKSSLNFNFQVEDSYKDLEKVGDIKFDKKISNYIKYKNYNMDYSQIEEDLPLVVFSTDQLIKYYNLGKTNLIGSKKNKNIFYKNDVYFNNIFDIIDNYGLDYNFESTFLSDVDLIVAPLLKIQANIIRSGYSDNGVLSDLKIPEINKNDMLFGINKEDVHLYSIIEKSFNLITKKEWEDLNKKWKDIYLSNKVLSVNDTLVLSNIEKEYLKNKKTIKICTNYDLAPIVFLDESNKLNGISIDILNLLEKQMNILFKYKKIDSSASSSNFLHADKCDILLNVENEELFNDEVNFTKAYLEYKMAIITKKENPLIFNLESVLDKVVSLKKDSIFYQKIKEKSPKTPILDTKTHRKALELVNNNQISYTISSLPIASYNISKYAMNDLYVSLYTDIVYDMKMAVRKDDIILLNLLNKSLDKVTQKEKKEIHDKWISSSIKEVIDYSFIFTIVGIVLLLLSILVYRQVILNKYNKELKKAHDETKQKSLELELLTNTLEHRVKEEVAQNEQKSKHLIQQSRMAQMGELLSMIAHQWRQPLSYISTTANYIMAQSLLKKPLNKKELEEELALILDYSQHLSTTISDFKNFYKIDKEKTNITIESIAQKSINIIQASLEENNISLETNFRCNKEIYTYATEINQVILNLLKNAEDALLDKNIKDGKIIVNTFLKDEIIYLEIIDNAGGINTEYFDKLFDPYFSTKIAKDGSGLGLYMSKIIIEDHCQGTIVANNYKDGAMFIVTFPSES